MITGSASWFGGAVAVMLLFATGGTSAQPTEADEQRVRDLYASAEYEEALVVLGTASSATMLQYKALCLLALGRQAEAETAVRSLVVAAPELTVSAEEMAPKFVEMLTHARGELLPDILQELFATARQQYRAKAVAAARAGFEKVLALSSPPDVRDVDRVADLRLLAEGFIDLSETSQSSPPTNPVVAESAPDVPLKSPTTKPAVAVRQVLPPWPVDLAPVETLVTGAVRVRISALGKVTSADVIKSVHPRYDRDVLATVHRWEYSPATVNGAPVESESNVEIRIYPRR
jgi:TonB family protein